MPCNSYGYTLRTRVLTLQELDHPRPNFERWRNNTAGGCSKSRRLDSETDLGDQVHFDELVSNMRLRSCRLANLAPLPSRCIGFAAILVGTYWSITVVSVGQ